MWHTNGLYVTFFTNKRYSADHAFVVRALTQAWNCFCRFCSNKLVTSKYTALSFVPSNLFQQFLQPANLYFLLIALIQLVPGLSPTSWITTFAPLSLVLILNGVKEAYDDRRHHVADRLVSTPPYCQHFHVVETRNVWLAKHLAVW